MARTQKQLVRSRAPVTSDRFTFSYRCPRDLAQRFDRIRARLVLTPVEGYRPASRTELFTQALEEFVERTEKAVARAEKKGAA